MRSKMEVVKLNIPSYWLKHIEAWQTTGSSQAKYCREHQLKPHQFSYYKCQLIKQEKHSSAQESGFIQLPAPSNLMPTTTSPALCLHLSEQQSIEGITSDNIHLIQPLLEYLS